MRSPPRRCGSAALSDSRKTLPHWHPAWSSMPARRRDGQQMLAAQTSARRRSCAAPTAPRRQSPRTTASVLSWLKTITSKGAGTRRRRGRPPAPTAPRIFTEPTSRRAAVDLGRRPDMTGGFNKAVCPPSRPQLWDRGRQARRSPRRSTPDPRCAAPTVSCGTRRWRCRWTCGRLAQRAPVVSRRDLIGAGNLGAALALATKRSTTIIVPHHVVVEVASASRHRHGLSRPSPAARP